MEHHNFLNCSILMLDIFSKLLILEIVMTTASGLFFIVVSMEKMLI